MEVSGGKKSTRISLDISPLFFHTVYTPAEALVIAYDEISQAVAAEGDVLLQKPFLDPHPSHHTALTRPPWTFTCLASSKNISEASSFHLTVLSKPRSRNGFWRQKWHLDLSFDAVIRWKLPALEMFFELAKRVKVQGGQVRAVWWEWYRPEMASGAGCLLLPPGLGKSHHM
jgi:hypothetical protein